MESNSEQSSIASRDPSVAPSAFTRWGVRLLGVALLFWGGTVIYSATSMWSEWGELGEVLAALAEGVGWTAEGWLAAIRAILGLAVVAGVILLALAWGVWRRQAGAWFALTALVLLTLVWTPIQDWLMWGPEAVKSHGWTGWLLHVAFWSAGGWFLLRRQTRHAFLIIDGKLPWRSWWMAVVAAWIVFITLTPALVVGLKVVLYRTEGTPFWRTAPVPEEIQALAPQEKNEEWESGDLYGFSFGMPAGTRLVALPRIEDKDWGMVALATQDKERESRRSLIVSPETIVELMPESVLENLGVGDAIEYAHAIYGTNWSFWPLIMSHIGGRPMDVFFVEDEKRQAVAILDEGRSERIMMRITVQFPEMDGAWEVVYMPVGREEDRAALVARKTGLMARPGTEDTPERNEIPENGPGDLLLLRTYWSGDLDAGLELVRRLIDRQEPRPPPAERLLEEIAAQVPEHPEIPALREALEELEE